MAAPYTIVNRTNGTLNIDGHFLKVADNFVTSYISADVIDAHNLKLITVTPDDIAAGNPLPTPPIGYPDQNDPYVYYGYGGLPQHVPSSGY